MNKNIAPTKVLSLDAVTPYLEGLRRGTVTQRYMAETLGVSQPSLSNFLLRHGLRDEYSPGRGGKHPASTPEMDSAVAEVLSGAHNMALIARRRGVDYLGLQRRVKKLQQNSGAVEPVPETNPDEELLACVVRDPARLAKAAAVIRAAGI